MDAIAHRIVLPEVDDAQSLPLVIKREEFAGYLESSSVLERSRIRAEQVLARARAEADSLRSAAVAECRDLGEQAYLEARERGREDAASELLETSRMAESFVRDVEGSIVATVIRAVREIVSRFDDVTLVEATVKRALRSLETDVRATLSVADGLRADVERRLDDLPGAGSLNVVSDATLQGASCRLESGRMVIVGDVDEQLTVLRSALERRIAMAGQAMAEPEPGVESVSGREVNNEDES